MPGEKNSTLSIEQRIDLCCVELQRDLRSGNGRTIESVLPEFEPQFRDAALLRLLKVELEHQWNCHRRICEEQVQLRFPEMKDVVASAFSWAREELLTQENFSTKPAQPGDANFDLAAVVETPNKIGRFDIIDTVGSGGFGQVYRAIDPQLGREVALKAAGPRLLNSDRSVEALLDEARASASLRHPGIVQIYEIEIDHNPPFIVQELIDGTNLRLWMKTHSSFFEVARTIVMITEAMGYAHANGLFHLDLKPSNILMDSEGRAHVADFGLAVHENSQSAHAGQVAGTPAYMSPEQIRGETHRLDGRADVWAVGVILYEWLTGQRPFVGSTMSQLATKILTIDARPPRQRYPRIPEELERICLKCLEKRSADRYGSMSSLSDDVQYWLATRDQEKAVETTEVIPQKELRVIPRGLRSFDESDSDFFLDLIPGPRDRDGLPDSIGYWKKRFEERDSEHSFSVGLLYGPSGCGKSSFLKAGVLPLLNSSVKNIYIESSSDHTERRLLSALRSRFHSLDPELSLSESLAELRTDHRHLDGDKLIIIVDQFEQWLSSRRDDSSEEFVRAIRQCDGVNVQCLIMVRDDFYLAVNRFFRNLEVPLYEGENCSLLDLFDVEHAEKVLTLFGQAYGRLPQQTAIGESQRDFVKKSVQELAVAGKVICVRLALFAQMMKARNWSSETLQELGGIAGVGEIFLEETFATAATAPLKHRYHQSAARSVLSSLMPSEGMEIKGHMRSEHVLADASGYELNSDDFSELIKLLDNELRLITPVDLEQLPDAQVEGDETQDNTHYQLTHDYMVGPLREWLTRKQRATSRGRAALKLASRTKHWIESKRDRTALPGTVEWLRITTLVPTKDRTKSQTEMLRAASRHQAANLLFALTFLFLIVLSTVMLSRRPSTPFDVLANGESSDEERIRAIAQIDLTEPTSFGSLADSLSKQTDGDVLLAIVNRLAESNDLKGGADSAPERNAAALALFLRPSNQEILPAQEVAIDLLKSPSDEWLKRALARAEASDSAAFRLAIFDSFRVAIDAPDAAKSEWRDGLAQVVLDTSDVLDTPARRESKSAILHVLSDDGFNDLDSKTFDRLILWCIDRISFDDAVFRSSIVQFLNSIETSVFLDVYPASRVSDFSVYVQHAGAARCTMLAEAVELRVSEERTSLVETRFSTVDALKLLSMASALDQNGFACDIAFQGIREQFDYWSDSDSDFEDFQFAEALATDAISAYRSFLIHRRVTRTDAQGRKFFADLISDQTWGVAIRREAIATLTVIDREGDAARKSCLNVLDNSPDEELRLFTIDQLVSIHPQDEPDGDDIAEYLIDFCSDATPRERDLIVSHLGNLIRPEKAHVIFEIKADDESKGEAMSDLMHQYPDQLNELTRTLMQYVQRTKSQESYFSSLVNLIYRTQSRTNRIRMRDSLSFLATNSEDPNLASLCAETITTLENYFGTDEQR